MRVQKVHTIESLMARTIEIGDCMEWTGYCQNETPFVVSGGVKWMVRRLVKHLQGRPLYPGVHFGTHCGNPKCVNPDHIAERRKADHMRLMAKNVDHNHPIRIAKLQKAAESRRVLSDESLAMIRSDDRNDRIVAADFGVSKSLINKIRQNKSRKIVNASINPFAGLMR